MGVFATAVYDVRNMDKFGHGDTGRIGASFAQTTNLLNAAANSRYETLRNGANAVLNGVDNLGSAVGVTNAASKVTNFASKAVNPLLCVASGVRILKDDDQYAALIEESCAMSTMFASEKLFKTLIANPITEQDFLATKKTATKFSQKIAKWASKLSKGHKTLATIVADLALVGVSIISYDAGKKVGQTLSHRDERALDSGQVGLDYKS